MRRFTATQEPLPTSEPWARYHQIKKRLEPLMLLLTVALIPITLLPLVEDLSSESMDAIRLIAGAIWVSFVTEYAVLFWVAPKKTTMVKHHKLDLFVIVLPFIRTARLLRFARILLAGSAGIRSSNTLARMLARPGFARILSVSVLAVLSGGVFVTLAEYKQPESTIEGIGDGLWWAVVTSTTVGYGDEFPVTTSGRLIAVALMLIGISTVSFLTANVAAHFANESADETEKQLTAIQLEIVELKELLSGLDAAEPDRRRRSTDIQS